MKLTLACVALVAAGLAGCRSDKPDKVIIERERPSEPRTIVIEKEHSHGPGCGHYYYNGRWYAEAEHVHIVD